MAPNPYQQVAIAAAKAYGLDPSIFSRQIQAESNFNPSAKSGAGAEGIAQFMPATAQGYGVNPWDPNQALYGAAKMDAGNLKKYGSYARMLSAYNSGNPDAYKDPNFARGETANYVNKILNGQNPYVASGGTTPAPSATDNNRNLLLASLMQSNNAIGKNQAAPSLVPMLLAMQQGQPATAGSDIFAPSSGMKLVNLPQSYTTNPGIELNSAVAPEALGLASKFGVKINSGYRSPSHNADVGGAKNSDHLSGNAVDFTGSAKAMKALYTYANQHGYAYVEPWSQTGGSHVHISFIR